MKALIFTIIIASLCMDTHAQVCYNLEPITNLSRAVTDKNKFGEFTAQRVKDKTTGSGLFLKKNGSVYIGDFNDKQFHGKGIFIPAESDSISFCPGTAYFVGKYKQGKKNGKGTCFNADGIPIYIGQFSDDRPLGEYPSNPNSIKYFADFKGDGFYYIGEFDGEYPNGFGAMFFDSGDFLISKFEEGVRTGISVCIESGGGWFSENIQGDNVTPISSSYEYEDLVRQSKAAFRAGMTQAFGCFVQAVNLGSQMAQQINNLHSTSSDYPINTSFDADSDTSYEGVGSNKGSSNGRNNLSEQQSYNRDKSTYSKYDGMLAQYFAGTRNASESEKRQWQSKMKSLREKWEKKGRDFPHFPNEDR